jgi:hypothetical protein
MGEKQLMLDWVRKGFRAEMTGKGNWAAETDFQILFKDLDSNQPTQTFDRIQNRLKSNQFLETF